jgi:type II secretory pathway component PulL
MGKALALLFVGALVAAFLVPFHGLTLYQRAARRLSPPAAETHRQRAPQPVRRERIRSETPKERLSDRDRKALDRLVSETGTSPADSR